jgi:serine/threonine protein phosphatase PrpC
MVKAKLRSASGSDPGRVRSNNEDAAYVDAERGIFLVVDGIGGQAAGEKAAEIAVSRVKARLERQTGTAEQRIREAIAVANNEIVRAAKSNPEWEGMACVLTVAVLENGSAVVGHVGDSRLYQVRRGAIRKVTHDHSPVGEREDNREITESEAMRHPRRNEVFRDVGSEERQPDDANFIEVQRVTFDPDSALVLCSDGLSDQVASEEIRRAVERNAGNPDRTVEELIQAANGAGGKDNVTVIVVEGEEFRAPAAAEPRVERRGNGWMIGAALFLCGVAVAAAGAWLLRTWWLPQPLVVAPQVWKAGPGASIASALEKAKAGDTVEVESGEYTEPIRLKAGVAVRSRVPRGAILRADPVGGGPAVMADNIKGASLVGFRIVADPKMPLPQGILIVNSEVELTDNAVEGAGVGIEIRGGASPSLRGNAIRDSVSEGLLIQGPSAAWVSHNTFQSNKGAGLAARDGAKPALVGNVFDKNGIDLPADQMPAVKEHNFLLDLKAGKKR